jgi:hypothetical protein
MAEKGKLKMERVQGRSSLGFCKTTPLSSSINPVGLLSFQLLWSDSPIDWHLHMLSSSAHFRVSAVEDR